MPASPFRYFGFLVAACLVAAALPTVAQQLAGEAPDLSQLTGRTVTIHLMTGRSLPNVEVLSVVAGTEPGSIKSLTVKVNAAGQKQLVGAATVAEIFEKGESLDVAVDKKTRALAHHPERRQQRIEHHRKVQERLAAQRDRLWPVLSSEEQEAWIAKHKEYLASVQTGMNMPLQLVETKYYLFLTDMTPQEANPYLVYLDAMYEHLSKAFGIPAGENIWAGKCMVVAFRSQADFLRFELQFMQHSPGPTVNGLCHSFSDGRVLIAVYRGQDVSYFGHVLVHETAHGFVHRYKSSARIPSWVNEGIAEWVAHAVVKGGAVPRRQAEAAARIRMTLSFGGNYYDEQSNIDGWQYGLAAGMVDMMLKGGGPKYRRFFDNMKEGMTASEALQDSYGITLDQLTQAYGRAINAPGPLRP